MKKKIGTWLISLGTVLLIAALSLVVYNEWEADQAQKASNEVLDQLEDRLDHPEDYEDEKNDGDDSDEYVDLQEKEDPEAVPEMTTVTIDGNEYIGYISVPSAGLALPVMAEWSYDGLKIAPGRFSGSVFTNNLVICGHNYARHFSPIKWLDEGDDVVFTDMDGTEWDYTVARLEVVKPTNVEEMITATEDDSWDLTLFTCTTGGRTRCAVRCVYKAE